MCQSMLLRFAFGNLSPLKSLEVIITLGHLSYEKRLRELDTTQDDLVNVYKYLMEGVKNTALFSDTAQTEI